MAARKRHHGELAGEKRGAKHRHENRRLPGRRQAHDQHRLVAGVSREGDRRRFGLNVEAESPEALANTLEELARNASLRKIMGARGRAVAEREFDQRTSYLAIVNLLRNLL